MSVFDCLVVVLYLAGTLALGIWSGRKVWTIREFAVDPGRFSTVALYATIFATYIGGWSTIGIAEKTFSTGIVMSVISIIGSLDLLLIGIFVAPKMGKFLGNAISPGEVAGLFWGRSGVVMTGVTGMLYSLAGAAVQVSAIGRIFHYMMGVSFELGAWIGFGMLVVYSAFGGIRAVVATDKIQYAVLAFAIPLVTYFAVAGAGGLQTVFTAAPAGNIDISPLWTEPFRYLPILASYLICIINPVWMQRLLMGRDIQQLQKTFCLGTLTVPLAYICATLIGLSALVSSPAIEPSSVMAHTINTIVPIGFKGIVISGLLAVLMSTADSYLNIAGVMLACDVLFSKTAKGAGSREMLRYSRLTTLGLGLLSLVVALYFKDIINIALYFDGFWYSTVAVPIMVSILGYRSTRHAFNWASWVGGGTVALWLIFDMEGKTGIYGFFPGMTLNALLLFGLSAYGKRSGIFTREEEERIRKGMEAVDKLKKLQKKVSRKRPRAKG